MPSSWAVPTPATRHWLRHRYRIHDPPHDSRPGPLAAVTRRLQNTLQGPHEPNRHLAENSPASPLLLIQAPGNKRGPLVAYDDSGDTRREAA
jgi:hypothetical protein